MKSLIFSQLEGEPADSASTTARSLDKGKSLAATLHQAGTNRTQSLAEANGAKVISQRFSDREVLREMDLRGGDYDDALARLAKRANAERFELPGEEEFEGAVLPGERAALSKERAAILQEKRTVEARIKSLDEEQLDLVEARREAVSELVDSIAHLPLEDLKALQRSFTKRLSHKETKEYLARGFLGEKLERLRDGDRNSITDSPQNVLELLRVLITQWPDRAALVFIEAATKKKVSEPSREACLVVGQAMRASRDTAIVNVGEEDLSPAWKEWLRKTNVPSEQRPKLIRAIATAAALSRRTGISAGLFADAGVANIAVEPPSTTMRHDCKVVLTEWGTACVREYIRAQAYEAFTGHDRDALVNPDGTRFLTFENLFEILATILHLRSAQAFPKLSNYGADWEIEKVGKYGLLKMKLLQGASSVHDLLRPSDEGERAAGFIMGTKDVAEMVCLVGYAWASSGFPLLCPTHVLAASLMATHVPPDLVPELALPWKAFAVLIPDGLLAPIHDNLTRESHEPRMVGLVESDEGLLVFLGTKDNAYLHTWKISSLAELAEHVTLDGVNAEISRVREMVSRLLLQCLIEMDSPEKKELIHQGNPRIRAAAEKQDRRGKDVPPAAWTFELRRDVRVDLRGWVKDYVAGAEGTRKGSRISVQLLVRGHRKRQSYGPRSTLRKWITVEPYWKGPESAPIAVRAHALAPPKEKP